jgi:hypothetical protein
MKIEKNSPSPFVNLIPPNFSLKISLSFPAKRSINFLDKTKAVATKRRLTYKNFRLFCSLTSNFTEALRRRSSFLRVLTIFRF